MAQTICIVCGDYFSAERSKIARGARTCCSKSCRGKRAAALQDNGGRKPTHGGCVGNVLTPLYRRWSGIKARCHSKHSLKYGSYGARGIKMCRIWLASFSAFRNWSLANGFKKELQIDRINNNKGYSPGNCRWVSCLKNQANRRNSIVFPSGETTAEVAARLKMSSNGIRQRLASGMSKEAAMRTKYTPNGSKRKYFRKQHLNLWKDTP